MRNSIFRNDNNPAVTFMNGETVYTFSAFYGNYDKLNYIATHEMIHRNHILEGLNYNGSFEFVKAKEEYRTYLGSFKNQWRYPNHNMPLSGAINMYGSKLDYSHDRFLQYANVIKQPWWFLIYKVPRRW